MKKQKTNSEFIKKNNSPLNPFLIPISIILAGVLIMVSILLSATAILNDKVVTKANLKTTIADALKGANITNNGNQAPAANGPYDKNKVIDVAVQVAGVDKDKFTQCYQNQETKAEVQKDFNEAPTAGVRGTPGFIIGKFDSNGKITNGHRIKGAYPIESFRELIDAELAGTAGKYDEEIDVNDPTGDPQLTGSKYKFPKQETNLDDDPILGDKNKAKIAIVEFSDYECPFCKRHFSQVYPDLKREYIDTGKAVLVFRDYVIVPSHNPAATDTAIAAECVKRIGNDEKYFKFHDYMLENTRANGQGLP